MPFGVEDRMRAAQTIFARPSHTNPLSGGEEDVLIGTSKYVTLHSW